MRNENNGSSKFILVDNSFGYPMFPEIGKRLESTTTDVQSDTPVYDSREDNAALKIKFWNAATGLNFSVLAV